MLGMYIFYINNSETEIWSVCKFTTPELLPYYKLRDLSQFGWSYDHLRSEPFIELIENIELPTYTQPNSVILDLDFKGEKLFDFLRYKSLLTSYLRNDIINALFNE
jgi:hypothetical protein